MAETRFWHGFADMHSVKSNEVVFRGGEGVWIEDVDGRRYLDATAGLWYANVGYGRREIADAAAAQMVRLSAYSSFGAYTTEPTVKLAARLSAMAPMEDAVVFFGSGGSDAVETAAKLVRRYWDVMGRPDKRLIVSRQHGYHGMHGWGTSLAGIPLNKAGYGGDIIDEVEHVGWGDTAALEDLFQRRGGEIAAFVGEPVTGAGGVIPPEAGYWAEVQRLCRAHDVILIADEVITGFGRLGTMWGCERYAIDADIITFAKGVTSGYVPLGGIVVGERIRRPFWDDPIPGAVFRHGYTYSGHATACAAAMANLDILENEDLLARVRDLEPVLAASVGRLAAHPLVSEVRTVGLTAAVQLAPEVLAADPAAADKAVVKARESGVLTRALRGGAMQVSPAFVITPEEIDRLADGFGAALDALAAG